MFQYLYYRYWKFKQEFEKDNKIDVFADYCMDATLDATKRKGDKIREKIRHLEAKRKSYLEKRQLIEKNGIILEDNEYHTIRTKVKQLTLLLTLIFLAESGLNYFTSLIAIPLTDETRGLAFTSLRISVAFVVTAIGIVCADHLFEEVMPSKKYKMTEHASKKNYSVVRIMLWLVGLVVIEYMIYYFGLARVEDIEGGIVNNDTAKSLIILSMIVPVVAGGIKWEISNYKDAYRNRRKYDKYKKCIDSIETTIETLKEKENSYFQKKTNDYWHTFNRIKSFKEYFNKKKGQDTPELSEKQNFAVDYDGYYLRALNIYNQHKEKQDAIQRTKLSINDIEVGRKIGQENEKVL